MQIGNRVLCFLIHDDTQLYYIRIGPLIRQIGCGFLAVPFFIKIGEQFFLFFFLPFCKSMLMQESLFSYCIRQKVRPGWQFCQKVLASAEALPAQVHLRALESSRCRPEKVEVRRG